MANNLDNSQNSQKVNPSTYSNGSQNIFGFIHENPDAKVILNRGGEFEQDLTDWVMSFSTSNSVDDIAGSFNITLNNENDRFVDRYNNVKIAVVSSVEIFAKTSNGPKGIVDSRPATNSDIITVTERLAVNGAAPDLIIENVINHYYGYGIEKEQRDKYKSDIQKLNATRVVAYETMEDQKSTAMFGDVVAATDSSGREITEAWNGEESVEASEFFAHVKGREGQSVFYVTDLQIELDRNIPGSYAKNANGTYKFVTDVSTDNQPLPVISPALLVAVKSGNPNSTIFKPTIKSKEDPFMMVDNKPNANLVLAVGDMIRIPKIQNNYRKIFFGVITNISQNISPGSTMTISLNGKSLGYWLESSMINVQPAIEENQYQNTGLSFFANKYADSSALDIFRDLIRFSTDDLVAVTDFSLDKNSDSSDSLLLEGQNNDIATDSQGRVLLDEKGEPLRYDSSPSEKEKQLNQQKDNIYTNGPFSNPTDKSASGAISGSFSNPKKGDPDVDAWSRKSEEYKKNRADIATLQTEILSANETLTGSGLTQGGDAWNKKQEDISRLREKQSKLITRNETLKAEMDKLPIVSAQVKTIDSNLLTNQKKWANQLRGGREKLINEFGITKHWQRIFSNIILEVLDSSDKDGKKGFLSIVHPFRWDVRAPGWMDGDYQSKAEIGRTIAQNLMYEFYFDTNGHFVLKPPLYSISQQDNDSDYIITDMDVYSININETIDGVITRVGVAGAYYESPSTPKEMIYNVFQDLNLIKNYGVQSRELSNLLFIRNNADCRAFGRAFMSRNNVDLKNASVTIYGRPEIRLGTSIYLQPRDTVYYIKGISHDFNVGDGITTTLTLVGARRIIRGFKSRKKITQYYKVLQADGTFTISKTAPKGVSSFSTAGDSLEIEYYVPLNATNFSDLPINSNPQLNQQINKQLNIDNNNQSSQGQVQDNRVTLLQNVYTITSHPNTVLIGMIVDSDSVVLNQINKNYYAFLIGLQKYVGPQFDNNHGNNELNPAQPKLIPVAATKLVETFKIFVGITPPPKLPEVAGKTYAEVFLTTYGFEVGDIIPQTSIKNGEGFYYKYLNFFLTSQYKKIASLVADKTQVKNANEYDTLDTERNILDLLIKDIDAFGSYIQYTDSYARELPSYVDFGKSMTIYQTDLVLNSSEHNIGTKNAIKSEKERLALAVKGANAALGENAKNKKPTLKNSKPVIAVGNNGSISSSSSANSLTNTAKVNTQLDSGASRPLPVPIGIQLTTTPQPEAEISDLKQLSRNPNKR